MGEFIHASVDSSFRSQRPSSDLFIVTEGSTTLTRTYDGRGRLKSFTTADGDLIQYLYDANNNLTRLTYPDGKQVNYSYNSRNLLATVTDWSNRVTTYTYDRLGRLTGTTRPNGTSNQIAHDAPSQLTSVKEYAGTKLISYLAFKYDAAGQIESRFRAPLINSGWQHPALTATYDDDNRLLTANGTNVTHDADGNMTRGVGILPTSPNTSIDLTYNSRNQLTNAAGTTYTYDAEGRRRTLTDATGTTRDTIDPSGKLLVRTHPNGTKTYYVYGLGLLYEANQANATKTYHFDQVGSTLLRTNDSGVVIGRAEYSAYGIQFWKQGDMATPFLYNGQAGVQTDPNGLLNMRARYYSPYLCRFLNADPIGFSGGSNWFAYADGNPISKSDPFGLCAAGGFSAASSAIGQYAGGYASSMWGNAGNLLKSANPIAAIYNSPQTARAGLQAISSPVQTFNNAIDNVADTWHSGPRGQGEIIGTIAFNIIAAGVGGEASAARIANRTNTLPTSPGAANVDDFAAGGNTPLRRIHSDRTVENDPTSSLDYQRSRSSGDLIESLSPNAEFPLRTWPDGRIFDGNTRIKVLEERGVDVNTLPRRGRTN